MFAPPYHGNGTSLRKVSRNRLSMVRKNLEFRTEETPILRMTPQVIRKLYPTRDLFASIWWLREDLIQTKARESGYKYDDVKRVAHPSVCLRSMLPVGSHEMLPCVPGFSNRPPKSSKNGTHHFETKGITEPEPERITYFGKSIGPLKVSVMEPLRPAPETPEMAGEEPPLSGEWFVRSRIQLNEHKKHLSEEEKHDLRGWMDGSKLCKTLRTNP